MSGFDGAQPGAGMPAGVKVLDRLVGEQRIDQNQYQRILNHAQRVGERVEDAIVSTGTMKEAELLKYLAGVYRTRFVSTKKLARADIDRRALQIVPKKVCRKLGCCPVLLDRRTQTLSVVASDLEMHDIAKQVQVVSDARDVQVLVGLPKSVQAAIRKHYEGDAAAFASLDEGSGLLTVEGFEQDAIHAQSIPAYSPDDHTGFNDLDDRLEADAAPARTADRSAQVAQPAGQPGPAAGPPKGGDLPAPPSFTIEAPDIAADLEKAAPRSTDSAPTPHAYLETLNVLVALIEQDRGALRGHTALVARLCRKVCERLELSNAAQHGVLVAAYLHDVGKASTYHLTALNVAQYEGHRVQAQKAYLMPVRMFEAAELPEETIRALGHMYERADGQGFPDRLKGKDIPRGARILAIVETYADLTQNAKNPFRRTLDPKEACDALERYRDVIFDGGLLDVFRREVLGGDLRARLLSERRVVLLVDPDPEETTVLEMRLMDHGFDVAIARDARDALQRFAQGDVDVVISEVELSQTDGFALVEKLKQHTEAPVLFLTRRSDRDSVKRGFDLGATDYLVKPASADVVAAKAEQVVDAVKRDADRRPGGRGVSGSLTEMSLPDVIQILANGRKGGKLSIRSGGQAGELCFAEGTVWDARFGNLRGEEAVYAMLVLEEGDFQLDPSFTPTERTIEASTESLLLEGMRRLDEARA